MTLLTKYCVKKKLDTYTYFIGYWIEILRLKRPCEIQIMVRHVESEQCKGNLIISRAVTPKSHFCGLSVTTLLSIIIASIALDISFVDDK